MAAITAANVTTLSSFPMGTVSGKLVERRDRVAIALTTQGATLGDIPASVLGYAEIYSVILISFVTAGNAYANIGVGVATQAADLSTSINTFTAIDGTTAPANVTGTLTLQIEGRTL
jgi:hypothetical protein